MNIYQCVYMSNLSVQMSVCIFLAHWLLSLLTVYSLSCPYILSFIHQSDCSPVRLFIILSFNLSIYYLHSSILLSVNLSFSQFMYVISAIMFVQQFVCSIETILRCFIINMLYISCILTYLSVLACFVFQRKKTNPIIVYIASIVFTVVGI